MDKNGLEQSIEQYQHPGEGAQIHEVRPQGMENQRTKQRNTSQQQKLQKTLPDSTVQQSRQRYRVENTTILIK